MFLLGATRGAEVPPDDLIRQANAAFEAGEIAAADRLYARAEELTADPGLVAFNRAAVLVRQGKYGDAAGLYQCVLRDAECPPERAAAANYNRGTCLLNVGGSSRVYMEAIRHLGLCHDSDAADAPLKAKARDNLELAKTLWKKAYDQEKEAGKNPENPNDRPPPDAQNGGAPKYGDPEEQPGPADPGAGNATQTTTQPMTQPDGTANTNVGQTTTQGPAPTATPDLPKYPNAPDLQPRSPEATRNFLRDTANRLQRERRILDDSLYTSQLGIRDR